MKKKYPFVKQDGLKDCACATVLMIIKYYNGFIRKSKLEEMLKINKNGTTAYHIVETFNKIGFKAYGIKCDLNDIKNHPKPFIANVIINNSYRHFIVVYEINNDYLLIADPADRIKKISKKNFQNIWTGISLHMYPIKPVIKMNNVSIFKILKNLVISNRLYLLLIFFLSLMVMFLSVGTSFLFKTIIDDFNGDLTIIIIFLFILLLMKNFFDYLKNHLVISLNKKIDNQVTTDVYKKIIYLPYSYYQGKTTGEIISRINDLNYIREFIIKIVLSLFLYLPLLVLTTSLIFIFNKILFIIIIVVLFFYTFLIALIKKTIINLVFTENLYKANANSYMVETISGFETIKGLGIENKIIDKFKKIHLKKVQSTYKLDKFYNIVFLIKENINVFCQIISLLIGSYLVKNGEITIGTMFVYLILMNYLFVALNEIIVFDFHLKEVKEALERILDLTYFNKTKATYKKLNGLIKIEKLSYSFDDVTENLTNINLTIFPGEKVLITGKSGSGKSTLLKIIKGFYKKECCVKIDNIDINKLDDKAINDCVVYLGQNETLFTGTLLENLTLKDNNYKKNMHISKVFEIFQKEPLGVNMLIEENGFNLSEGQKQRIALARVLDNFNVLLLDEALNAVDKNMERSILKVLFKQYRDKTIIVVSHRLDNLDLFDRMIKMYKGEIILDEKRSDNNFNKN